MRVRNLYNPAVIAATNVLARTKLGAITDAPRQGKLAKLILHIDTIAGALNFAKITLGNIDADRRYYLPVASGAWEVDAADATKATLILDIDKSFVIDDIQLADVTNYTGWWLGLQLDAGTANVNCVLVMEN